MRRICYYEGCEIKDFAKIGDKGSIPDNAFEISEKDFKAAIALQSTIKPFYGLCLDDDKNIITKEPTLEIFCIQERAWRDSELKATDYMVMPDYPWVLELEKDKVLLYRQQLRDWPQSEDFPNKEKRPKL